MVRHQTVGIKRAERRQAVALVIILLQHQLHASEHTHIVLRILEDILPVDAPKHHVVDTFIKDLIDYIEYYNNERIKLRFNGMSPVQYRKMLTASIV